MATDPVAELAKLADSLRKAAEECGSLFSSAQEARLAADQAHLERLARANEASVLHHPLAEAEEALRKTLGLEWNHQVREILRVRHLLVLTPEAKAAAEAYDKAKAAYDKAQEASSATYRAASEAHERAGLRITAYSTAYHRLELAKQTFLMHFPVGAIVRVAEALVADAAANRIAKEEFLYRDLFPPAPFLSNYDTRAKAGKDYGP